MLYMPQHRNFVRSAVRYTRLQDKAITAIGQISTSGSTMMATMSRMHTTTCTKLGLVCLSGNMMSSARGETLIMYYGIPEHSVLHGRGFIKNGQ